MALQGCRAKVQFSPERTIYQSSVCVKIVASSFKDCLLSWTASFILFCSWFDSISPQQIKCLTSSFILLTLACYHCHTICLRVLWSCAGMGVTCLHLLLWPIVTWSSLTNNNWGRGEHSGIAAAGAADMGLDAFSSRQSTCWITRICCLLHWHLCSYLVIAHSCLSLMWLINVLKDFSIFDLSSFFSNITTTQI